MNLVEKTYKYSQYSDSCQSVDTGQELTVQTQDAGGGNYIVISTDRWAIDADQIDQFCAELKKILTDMD